MDPIENSNNEENIEVPVVIEPRKKVVEQNILKPVSKDSFHINVVCECGVCPYCVFYESEKSESEKSESESESERVRIQLKFMKENTDCVICGTNLRFFKDENKNNILGETRHPFCITWDDFLETKIDWFMNHQTLCYRIYACYM